MTVLEFGERNLLARIRGRLAQPAADVVVGVGDDAAVVAPARNTQLVLTTDALVEGVHFERRFSTPFDIGHKALAVNLSDLAAMGATPRWVLLSLALPDALPVEDVDGLIDGLVALGDQYRVAVIGGNLTRSPGPLMVDLTAVGTVRPRRVLTRGGGKPGDVLLVSGTIGAGAAGLEMLREGIREPGVAGWESGVGSRESEVGGRVSDVWDRLPTPDSRLPTPDFRSATCIDRCRRPVPRVRLGMALAQGRAARATVDLSDGLADALHQIADASGCGVEVEASALPIDEEALRWWTIRGAEPVSAALTGGDDYELLVAVPPTWRGRLRHVTRRVAEPPLTRIGLLTHDSRERVLLRDGQREPLPQGFEHFRK